MPVTLIRCFARLMRWPIGKGCPTRSLKCERHMFRVMPRSGSLAIGIWLVCFMGGAGGRRNDAGELLGARAPAGRASDCCSCWVRCCCASAVLPVAVVDHVLEWAPVGPLDRRERAVGRIAKRDQPRAESVFGKAQDAACQLLIGDRRMAAADA